MVCQTLTLTGFRLPGRSRFTQEPRIAAQSTSAHIQRVRAASVFLTMITVPDKRQYVRFL
jgi:hypothetical protein